MISEIPDVVGLTLPDALELFEKADIIAPGIVYYERDRRPDASLPTVDVVVRQRGLELTVCRCKTLEITSE